MPRWWSEFCLQSLWWFFTYWRNTTGKKKRPHPEVRAIRTVLIPSFKTPIPYRVVIGNAAIIDYNARCRRDLTKLTALMAGGSNIASTISLSPCTTRQCLREGQLTPTRSGTTFWSLLAWFDDERVTWSHRDARHPMGSSWGS
jgi:hypothetical protein